MDKFAFLAALERDAPLVLDGGLATQIEAQGCDIGNALWSASLLLDTGASTAQRRLVASPKSTVKVSPRRGSQAWRRICRWSDDRAFSRMK